MPEIFVLYIFFAMMVLNLLGSFIYLVGLNNVKEALRKSFRSQPGKPQ